MPSSMTLIAHNVVTSNLTSAVISFSSIPSTYTDLLIYVSARTNGTGQGDGFVISANGSTADFSAAYFFNNNNNGAVNAGSSLETSPLGFGTANDDGNVASSFGQAIGRILDYKNTTYPKVFSLEQTQPVNASGTNTAYHFIKNGLWNQNTAITSLSFTTTNSLYQYSIISLYGITQL